MIYRVDGGVRRAVTDEQELADAEAQGAAIYVDDAIVFDGTKWLVEKPDPTPQKFTVAGLPYVNDRADVLADAIEALADFVESMAEEDEDETEAAPATTSASFRARRQLTGIPLVRAKLQQLRELTATGEDE
jgi:hypothetical protein